MNPTAWTEALSFNNLLLYSNKVFISSIAFTVYCKCFTWITYFNSHKPSQEGCYDYRQSMRKKLVKLEPGMQIQVFLVLKPVHLIVNDITHYTESVYSFDDLYNEFIF